MPRKIKEIIINLLPNDFFKLPWKTYNQESNLNGQRKRALCLDLNFGGEIAPGRLRLEKEKTWHEICLRFSKHTDFKRKIISDIYVTTTKKCTDTTEIKEYAMSRVGSESFFIIYV